MKKRFLCFALVLIILMSCFAFVIPVSAAPNVYYGDLYLSVIKSFDGTSAILKGSGGILKNWENQDNSLTFFKDDSQVIQGYDGKSACYKLDLLSTEYDYTVTVNETDLITKEITNTWYLDSSSLDVTVRDGYSYDVTLTKLEAYVEGTYYVKSREIYFWLPRIVDVTNYTGVIQDLQNDSDFNVLDYPSIKDDFSLDVVQVAESVDGDLFVYVYNPSDATVEVEAAKINMSLQHYEDRSPSYKLYDLTLVSTSETLDKYVVNDFTVSDDDYRYYNIAAVYTPYNEAIHEEADQSDDVIDYVASSVGKCFSAMTTDEGYVKYDGVSVNYVDVDIKAVGTIRYPNGFKLNGLVKTDSHFVAFNIDNYNVKHIYSATISYITQGYHYTVAVGAGSSETYDEKVQHTDDIYDYEKGELLDGGWFSKEYSWRRILSVENFQSQLNDYDHTLIVYNEDAINEAEYVIQFLETDYTTWNSSGVGNGYDSTRVSEVAILRLHFATPLGTYNLGAVSNIVSDDGNPDYEYQIGLYPDDKFGDLEIILSLIILLAFLVALPHIIKFIKSIYYGIRDGITTVIEFVVAIFVTPFEFLGSLFGGGKSTNNTKKRKGKKRGKRK